MNYVQESKLTDTLERELVRNELVNGHAAPQPFAFVTKVAMAFISTMADLKSIARKQDVQYANG